jgi:hypothetical protein
LAAHQAVGGNLVVEASRNAAMLANVLDGLEQANSMLRRVVIY